MTKLKSYLLLLGLLLSMHVRSLAQESDSQNPENEEAVAIAKKSEYENLLTQQAGKKDYLNSKLFTQWILDEINNDSLMRAEIVSSISEIEENGHNSSNLVHYYSIDKQYIGKLYFKEKDVSVKWVGEDKAGISNYNAVLHATDGYHKGYQDIYFNFSFKAKSEYFVYTKAYMITVVGYPVFTGRSEKAHDY